MEKLRFGGSLWVNVDVALRQLDQVYARVLDDLGMTIIEWYVMRALVDEDGQHPSQLAQAVGRAPTAFTPILDKLEEKDLITRRPDPNDRRAVLVYWTEEGKALQRRIRASVEQVQRLEQRAASDEEWPAFQRMLARLVAMDDTGRG